MVRREQGESGDDAYRISARLVHTTIWAILGWLVLAGVYMAIWAYGDAKWKATVTGQQTENTKDIADHERRLRTLEAEERR